MVELFAVHPHELLPLGVGIVFLFLRETYFSAIFFFILFGKATAKEPPQQEVPFCIKWHTGTLKCAGKRFRKKREAFPTFKQQKTILQKRNYETYNNIGRRNGRLAN